MRVTLKMILRMVDRAWVGLGGKRHLIGPAVLCRGPHDCGPASLYRVVPWAIEDEIVDAFRYCADAWPYGSVTNRDFQIAVRYLRLDADYSAHEETVGSLLDRCPPRCVALIPGHYIGIVDGKILPPDIGVPRNTTVHHHWVFRTPKRFPRVAGKSRNGDGNT